MAKLKEILNPWREYTTADLRAILQLIKKYDIAKQKGSRAWEYMILQELERYGIDTDLASHPGWGGAGGMNEPDDEWLGVHGGNEARPMSEVTYNTADNENF